MQFYHSLVRIKKKRFAKPRELGLGLGSELVFGLGLEFRGREGVGIMLDYRTLFSDYRMVSSSCSEALLRPLIAKQFN